MQGNRLLGLIILVLGILALSYGGFTYTKAEEKAQVGPLHVVTHEKETVNIPLWLGVAGTVGGVLLLAQGVKE